MGIITRMRKSGVYAIQCLANGKSYVGSTENLVRRQVEHFRLLRRIRHSNSYLQNAWNRYGENTFIFVILKYCSKRSLLKCEQSFIDKMNTYECGFNLRPKAASNSGWKASSEQRKNMGKGNKGREFSEEHRENLSKAASGKLKSKEHKRKISQSHIGMHYSDSTISKLSILQKGRWKNMTKEQRIQRERKRLATRRKNSKSAKRGSSVCAA